MENLFFPFNKPFRCYFGVCWFGVYSFYAWGLNQSLFLFYIYPGLLTLLYANWDLGTFNFSQLRSGHDSHRQSFYAGDDHIILCLCRMVYRHFFQWKIQSLYTLEFYFLLFCQGYIEQKEFQQILIYRKIDTLFL